MLVTNCGHNAEFHQEPEQVGSNIWTARMVAEVFRQQFFTAVLADDAGLDRYVRHRVSITEYRMILAQVTKKTVGAESGARLKIPRSMPAAESMEPQAGPAIPRVFQKAVFFRGNGQLQTRWVGITKLELEASAAPEHVAGELRDLRAHKGTRKRVNGRKRIIIFSDGSWNESEPS
jgi:hypothetical protein